MAISGISSLYPSSNTLFDTSVPRERKASFGQNNQSDTVSISSEAMDRYFAMKNGAQESDNQSAFNTPFASSAQPSSSNQSIFETQSTSDAQPGSVGDTVGKWYKEDFMSGTSQGPEYSQWLPENYAKYKEMIGEGGNFDSEYESKLNMVFDALGKEKVITDADLAEGVLAITGAMAEYKEPTTLEEMNLVVLTPDKISQLQAEGRAETAAAEQNLEKWEEENEKKKAD